MPFSNAALQTILFLAANPKGTGRLRLDQELRDIAEGLQRAQKRDQFNLEHRLAVRPRDIQRAMLDVGPQIIHFSGHGDGEQGLVFADDLNNIKLVDGTALAELFGLFADRITCVVLNGCYSEVQAKAITQHIPYVIGMNQKIGDKAAITFAVGFYDALGAGRDVEFAYKLGCTAIRMEGIAEHLTPVLLKQSTTVAATVQPKLDILKRFDLFLSYHSIDLPWVRQLAIALERRGVAIWLEQGELRSYDLFEDVLARGMAESRAVALIVSPDSLHSDSIYQEYSRALAFSCEADDWVQLVPVLLPGSDLPSFLSDLNWIDFRDPYSFQQSLDKLISIITDRKTNVSQFKPLKRFVLLDRRLAAELIVSYPRQSGSRRVDIRSQCLNIYALSLFEHVLIENQFGSILSMLVSKDELLRESVLFVPGETGDQLSEFSTFVAEASRAWLSNPRFQLSGSIYGRSKGSMSENLPDAVAYLQRMLLLARHYDAAIAPHPDRWRLYQHWFENCINPSSNAEQMRTVISLPEATVVATEAVSAHRSASVARIAVGMASVLVHLVRYGPMVYPFPAEYAKQHGLPSFVTSQDFTYEFCTAAMEPIE